MDSNIKWKLISNQALRFRIWDDEFVVYNSLSGDTHLLRSTAAQILLILQQVPSNATALTEALAPLLHVEMNDEFIFQIEDILADLDTLALIE
ncbi:MAG: HPr-rel-A system PqqD family peptide chaperone, partial [Gallionella sp.]